MSVLRILYLLVLIALAIAVVLVSNWLLDIIIDEFLHLEDFEKVKKALIHFAEKCE